MTPLQEDPLHLAACPGQAGIMTELLRHGADVDAKDFTVAYKFLPWLDEASI